MPFGKNFSSFSVVTQAPAFVLLASDLYFIESKNDKSVFLASSKDLISFINKLSSILVFGNNLSNLKFFFLKKNLISFKFNQV